LGSILKFAPVLGLFSVSSLVSVRGLVIFSHRLGPSLKIGPRGFISVSRFVILLGMISVSGDLLVWAQVS